MSLERAKIKAADIIQKITTGDLPPWLDYYRVLMKPAQRENPIKELAHAGFELIWPVSCIISSEPYPDDVPTVYDVATLPISALGFTRPAHYTDIMQEAHEIGFSNLPVQAIPSWCKGNRKLFSRGGTITFGIDPQADPLGVPRTLYACHLAKPTILACQTDDHVKAVWQPVSRFAFGLNMSGNIL